MSELPHILRHMLQKLGGRAELSAGDRSALLNLPFRTRTVEPHQYIAREGDRTSECCLMLDGFAYRQKATMEGSRQILCIHMRGD